MKTIFDFKWLVLKTAARVDLEKTAIVALLVLLWVTIGIFLILVCLKIPYDSKIGGWLLILAMVNIGLAVVCTVVGIAAGQLNRGK